MGRSIRCRRTVWAVVMTALFLLSGCTENANLFTSLDESEAPSLETVAAGSVISPVTPLSIQLAYPDEDISRATSLTVQLVRPDGEVFGELTFEEEELLEPVLPEVELPRPDPGPYMLVVEAMRGEEFLFRDERQIFVLTDTPRIRSVSVYPSSVGTDADAIAVADITSVAGTRPYLKWHFQETPIGEGYVDDGAAKMVFAPGENVGVHRISVDLYPWGPDEGVKVTERTTITAGTDVFVRTDATVRNTRNDALLLFPLNGSLEPSVDRLTQQFLPVSVGDGVVLDVREERLGYRMSPDSSMVIPYNMVPPDGEVRRLVFRLGQSDAQGEVVITINEENINSSVMDLRIDLSGDGSVRTDLASEEPLRREFGEPSPANPGWTTFSVLLFRRDNLVWAVPEVPGRIPRVVPVTDRQDWESSSFSRLTFRGEGSLLVESIEVVLPTGANQLFSPSYHSFLYHQTASPMDSAIRSTLVDLQREEAVLNLPEDHFFLWTTADGESRFLVRREGNIVTVYDPGPSARPERISRTFYPVRATQRVEEETVLVRQGSAYSVSPEGVITVPASIPSSLTVFSGSLSDRSDPAYLASVRN